MANPDVLRKRADAHVTLVRFPPNEISKRAVVFHFASPWQLLDVNRYTTYNGTYTPHFTGEYVQINSSEVKMSEKQKRGQLARIRMTPEEMTAYRQYSVGVKRSMAQLTAEAIRHCYGDELRRIQQLFRANGGTQNVQKG